MGSLNLADMFVTFLAVLGPQKVLLSFAHVGQDLDVRRLRMVAVSAAIAAAVVGDACALAAPWLATFFHVGTASLQLAAGAVFFIYAVGLVFGFHFDFGSGSGSGSGSVPAAGPVPGSGAGHGGGAAAHPVGSGFRDMLLPFVVSPLGVAAALGESLSVQGWAGRWTVAGVFAAVVAIDLACAWVIAPLLRRMPDIALEILSRLLGVLLTAVGVQLFLTGLGALGVHALQPH
ncbi:MAG: hypothetical protein ACRDN0_01925 [Trebonia sp.]